MAMHTVIFQQKGSVFYGGKVIDSNYPDSAICALDMGAYNVTANSAKTVYSEILNYLDAFSARLNHIREPWKSALFNFDLFLL